ncbi:MAG: sialidase family protein [Edaphobacter sp.]
MLSEATISPTQSGSSSWYGIEADPENSNNLIACGMKWDAQDNAQHGFVYASQDGGNIWHLALEDKNSKWVSEESCAFGVHGIAYFVADASKTDDTGMLHHDHGTTRIWISHDAGQSWALGITAGWTDFSASVIDRNPGPNQNRLYVFFNNLWTHYTSVDDKGKPASFPKLTDKVSEFDTAGNTIGLINYKDGDKEVNGPIYDAEMYKMRLHGSYPGQNLLLKDGSLLTLFWSKVRNFTADGKRYGTEFIFASQRTDPRRKSVSEPVIVQKTLEVPEQPEWKCDSYLSAPAAYAPDTNTVYATYLDGSSGKCTLMLEKSTDDGQTWSSSVWSEKLVANSKDAKLDEHDYRGLALARRGDGTLALLWRDSDKPDVWLFATSTDDGKTYSSPQQISTSGKSDGTYRVMSESLDLYVNQAIESKPSDDALLRINNHTGWGDPHTNGIAVTPDGVFHPIWTANGGQLHTAAIAVVKSRDRSKSEPTHTDGWQYETNSVKFTYGGSQQYDERENLLTETIVIRNSGTTALKGPLHLEIMPRSFAGVIYPIDAVTEGAGDGIAQYLDVGQYIPGDGLAPGASSTPIPLRFRFEPYNDAKQSGTLATVSLRLLTKGQEKSAAR